MKILIVTHNNNEKSGANRSLINLLNNWRLNDEIQLEVIINKSKGNLKEILIDNGIKFYQLDYGWICSPKRTNPIREKAVLIRSVFLYFKGLINLRFFLHSKDLTQFNLIYTNTSVVDFGARLAKLSGIPHIWHFREFGEEDFEFNFFLSKSVRKRLYNAASKVIVVSDALKEKYKFYLPDNKIEVIYNGLMIDEYLYNIHNDLHNPIELLISGQLSMAKGQDLAIKAVDVLAEKYPIVLNIAGQGDIQFLLREIKEMKHQDCVKLLGQVKDLYELRKRIDIELVCSQCEAFGRVTLEAMLHGIPVIGANSGGTIELIQDKETGLLFKNRDYFDLAKKVEELILYPSLRYKISVQGQKFARKFDVIKTSENILRVFKETIIQ